MVPMSSHDTNHDDGTNDNRTDRYAELVIGTDEYVIYDRENHHAWLQSDVAVSVAERR